MSLQFKIVHYDTLDSTNNQALAFAREAAPEGTVIVSNYQTHGRGRFKRHWISPRGKGLLFSVILRPQLKTSSASIITHWSAKAVADVLRQKFNLSAKLKKPNDVLVGGKKIAGILTESSGYGQNLEYVVVGIGLNVNHRRKDLQSEATSIYVETGRETEMDGLLIELLSNLDDHWKK